MVTSGEKGRLMGTVGDDKRLKAEQRYDVFRNKRV